MYRRGIKMTDTKIVNFMIQFLFKAADATAEMFYERIFFAVLIYPPSIGRREMMYRRGLEMSPIMMQIVVIFPLRSGQFSHPLFLAGV